MPSPPPPRSNSSSPISTKSKRKSWFSFHRRAKPRTGTEDTGPLSPPSAFTYAPPQPDTRLGPLQFAPARVQTLYITPSERNLYLAAMSQLDQGVQPLPLWAEPPPIIPRLPVSHPMDSALPNGFVPIAQYPLTTIPLSPKLVTSPGLPGNGLMIREEFRRPNSPSKATRHALLCLLPTSFLRFTGFEPKTLIAMDRTMMESWPQGVWLRSEEMDKMSRRKGNGENLTWKVELHGRAWKVKGSQELDSIRLLLAMLTTLATHGWSLVCAVQAAGMKKNCHNLLFRYDAQVEARPPAFFALSMPLADRLSVINAPNKCTPAILNAVRSAISSNSHLTGHTRKNHPSDPDETPAPETNKRLTWGNEGQAKGVKLEGFVHPGVFRFWIAGMRRWLGGTVKHGKVDNLHPQLLMSIMNHLSSIHFELAGSIPLLPLAKGRDVLFFYSLPGSGLTHLDTYRPDATAAPSSGSESPVIISRTNSFFPPEVTPGHSQQPTNTTADESEGGRVLPWTSVLTEDLPTSPTRVKKTSNGSTIAPPPPSAMPQAFVRQRTRSQDSSRPLIPSSAGASPRQKNILLKKNSLRRRSASGSRSIDLPPPEHIAPTAVPGAGVASTVRQGQDGSRHVRDSDQWSMVDVPAHVGRLGATPHEPAAALPSYPPALPPRHLPELIPRVSMDSASNGSVYEDTSENLQHTALSSLAIPQHLPSPPPPIPARPAQPTYEEFQPPSLALGNFVDPDTDAGQIGTVPLRDPVTRRAGSAMVDVGGGIGIPSMHGSVGYFPTGQSVISDAGHSDFSIPPPLPPPPPAQVPVPSAKAPLPPPKTPASPSKAGSSRTKFGVVR